MLIQNGNWYAFWYQYSQGFEKKLLSIRLYGIWCYWIPLEIYVNLFPLFIISIRSVFRRPVLIEVFIVRLDKQFFFVLAVNCIVVILYLHIFIFLQIIDYFYSFCICSQYFNQGSNSFQTLTSVNVIQYGICCTILAHLVIYLTCTYLSTRYSIYIGICIK